MTGTAPAGVVTEHRLGPLGEIPVGEGRSYVVAGEQVAVFHLRDGTVRATQATCPHRGGPLADGQVDERVVVCPLHAFSYVLATGRLATEDPEPAAAAPFLRVYPVRVHDDGVVAVTVPEDAAGSEGQDAAAG